MSRSRDDSISLPSEVARRILLGRRQRVIDLLHPDLDIAKAGGTEVCARGLKRALVELAGRVKGTPPCYPVICKVLNGGKCSREVFERIDSLMGTRLVQAATGESAADCSDNCDVLDSAVAPGAWNVYFGSIKDQQNAAAQAIIAANWLKTTLRNPVPLDDPINVRRTLDHIVRFVRLSPYLSNPNSILCPVRTNWQGRQILVDSCLDSRLLSHRLAIAHSRSEKGLEHWRNMHVKLPRDGEWNTLNKERIWLAGQLPSALTLSNEYNCQARCQVQAGDHAGALASLERADEMAECANDKSSESSAVKAENARVRSLLWWPNPDATPTGDNAEKAKKAAADTVNYLVKAGARVEPKGGVDNSPYLAVSLLRLDALGGFDMLEVPKDKGYIDVAVRTLLDNQESLKSGKGGIPGITGESLIHLYDRWEVPRADSDCVPRKSRKRK